MGKTILITGAGTGIGHDPLLPWPHAATRYWPRPLMKNRLAPYVRNALLAP